MKKEAFLGGGFFWCLEAVYRRIPGVTDIQSGYAGGEAENPTYADVCAGETGHAEVVRVTFDSEHISYSEILDIFWKAHDPTTLNRQGADVGTQYRSIILYTDPEQKQLAESSRENMQQSGVFKDAVVTEIVPMEKFYEAEDYHQEYYENNAAAGYCRLVIHPKLKKMNLI